MTKQTQDKNAHHKNLRGEYKQDWINGITETDYNALLNCIDDLAPSTILDLCGGTGELTKRLQEKGYNVILADYDQKLLDASKEKGVKKTVRVDVLKENLPRGLDAIVIKSAEHEFQPNKLATIHKKVYDALNDGGTYVAWDIYPENVAQAKWVSNYVKTKDTLAGDMHLVANRHIYSEQECIDQLKLAGFRDIRIIHRFSYNIQNSKLAQAYFSDANGSVDQVRKEEFYKKTTELINKCGDAFPMAQYCTHDSANKDYAIRIPALIVVAKK